MNDESLRPFLSPDELGAFHEALSRFARNVFESVPTEWKPERFHSPRRPYHGMD